MLSQRPKILFILHLPPPIHGAGVMGMYIKDSLLVNEMFNANYINLSTSASLKQIGKGGWFKFLAFLRLQYLILKCLLNTRYDLCYMTISAKGVGFLKDFFIVLIMKLFKIKIVLHFHNKGVSLFQNNVFYNLLYKIAFKNSKIILLSPLLYSDISKYVNKINVFYCANGIPKIDMDSKTSSRPLNNRPFRILFFSNMMKEKGVYVLLEACKLLKLKNINFECNFVGDWSDISEGNFVNELIKNELTSMVFAHGKKYNEDKITFFQSADVFIFPSLNETFGLVILEAMQFGMPVIATDEGGISDIVEDGETGFLVPKGGSIALVEKIEFLINNPEIIIKMGKAGKKRFKELFLLETFEKNICTILNQVLKSNE